MPYFQAKKGVGEPKVSVRGKVMNAVNLGPMSWRASRHQLSHKIADDNIKKRAKLVPPPAVPQDTMPS